MSKKILISGSTHTGIRRSENQDACIYRHLWSPDKALLAVIDGVGGYTGGERAAAIAKESIGQYMQIPRGDTLTMLREAVIFANKRIVEERAADQQVSEMCCVLTAAVADASAKYLYYVHVGDTRLYRFRNGILQKLTRDHSFVGIKEDAGELSEIEAMRHPQRNQILREVGSAPHRLDDEDFMDYGREELLPGDILLLCSDGLTDMITAQQISTVLASGQSMTQQVKSLVALANEMGGHDNITVVLLKHNVNEAQAQNPPVVPVPQATETSPVVNTIAEKETEDRIARSRKKFNVQMLLGIGALMLIAAMGWYLSSSKKTYVTLPDNVIHVRQPDSSAIDSGRASNSVRTVRAAIPGPATEQKTDTLRITVTQNLKDLERYADSTGKTLVLVPAGKSYQRLAAVEVTRRSARPGDTLLIKNLRLVGFDTGITVHIPLLMKTENLVFENIRYPFSYRFAKTNRTATALFTTTAQ